ncbi:MAG: hypothetical protein P8L37_07145 [Phycisphaerales bacterium]|nr:hypothetical protein [Phycisphaerales bacterium]
MISLALSVSLAIISVPDPLAAEAFDQVIQTVRNAAPVRVESTLQLESRIGKTIESSDVHKSVYVLDAPERGLIRSGDWRWRASEGELIITHAHDDSAYVRHEHEGTPLEGLRAMVLSMPDPYLAIAMGSAQRDEVCMQLHDQPLGLEPSAIDADGRRVRLQGDGASMTLELDAVGRPERGILDLEGTVGLPEGVRIRWTWTWSHASLSSEELEAAMLFERRNRKRVDSPLSLRVGSSDGAQEHEDSSSASEGGQ